MHYIPTSVSSNDKPIIKIPDPQSSHKAALFVQHQIQRYHSSRLYTFNIYIYFCLYSNQCCGSGSGRIRSFWVTRIRILYPQKDPCNLVFLVKYHCLKYSFVKIIFIFDFKCHKMIRFGKKMP